MLQAACQQFLGKTEDEIRKIAQETLEGHQRAIMGNMTVEVSRQERPSFPVTMVTAMTKHPSLTVTMVRLTYRLD